MFAEIQSLAYVVRLAADYGFGIPFMVALFSSMSAVALAALAMVLWHSRRAPVTVEEKPGRRTNNLEGLYVIVLIWAVVFFSIIGWAWIPQVAFTAVSPEVTPITVDVTARQFSWTLSTYEIPTNTPIRFVAVSEDVNHGFGVYGPDGLLLFQMQVIPGYDNVFIYTFNTTGTYKVVCMEYCGQGHPFMITQFTVAAAGG